MKRIVFLIVCLLFLVAACGSDPTPTPIPPATHALPTSEPAPTYTPPPEPTGVPAAPFELTSPAFDPEAAIPQLYSCDGEDVSPELAWTDPPDGTQSFLLIFDDPDAQEVAGFTWIHWIAFDIPGDARGLAQGDTGGGRQGANSWDRADYGGPCPPSGTHRYFFRLYALDAMLDLPEGATEEEVRAAMEGHVLAETELMGVYTR
jgi:Raf kinase inhibitor-like YbhB/YbcL family protein